jgi:hypothetical protein
VRTDVTLGPGAGEPNIVVAPDGGIYITPIDHVYRSLNGGQSFQDLGTSKTDGHGDGDLTVDAQGRLYWLGLSGSSGAIPFQSSDDQGTTWTAPTDLSGNQGTDREWIDATPDGVVHAYWRDNRGLVYRHSGDRGATWGPAVIMRGDAGADGPIVHDPTDPHRVYVSVPDGNGIELLVSEDDGASWDQHLVAPGPSDFFNPAFPTSLFPVAAVDTAGTVYVVWSWSQASPSVTKVLTRQGVLLTYSVDHGLHWSTPIPLSDGGKDGRMPWITAGRPGRVAVTWYQSVLGPGAANDVVPDEWDVKLWESVTADSPAPVAQTVTLSSSPNHIGSVCTMGLFCAAGGDRCLLDYFEDTTDVAGQPVATWSSCVLGTGVGVAVQGTDIHFGGVTGGTPLW